MPLQPRIIPVLLLHKGGLYKTKQFKKPSYVGDPINAVRIFNEKQVDELMILDIDCSVNNSAPNYELIEEIASEAFMPVAYGGGVNSLEIAKKLFGLGIEKVVLNTVLQHNTTLIQQIGDIYGARKGWHLRSNRQLVIHRGISDHISDSVFVANSSFF